MKKVSLLILTTLVFFSVTKGSISAQTPEMIKANTSSSENAFRPLIQKMKQENFLLKAMQHESKAQTYAERSSYAPFLPALSLSGSYSYGGSSNTAYSSQYGAAVTLRQNFFQGFNDFYYIKLSNLNSEQLILNQQKNKSDLSLQLLTALGEYIYYRKLTQLLDEISQRRRSNTSMVKLRFEGGREHKGSLMFSEAYYKQSTNELEQIKLQFQRTLVKISFLLGNQALELPATDHHWSQLLELLPSSLATTTVMDEKAIEKYAKLTPDWQLHEKKILSQKYNIEIAKADFYPALNMSFSSSRQDDKFFPQNSQNSFQISASYPIFEGGKSYYNYKGANENLQKLEQEQKQYLLQLMADFYDLRLRLQSVQLKMDTEKNFIEAVETRAKIARAQYNAGTLGFENWDLIENDLISRQKNFLQAEYDLFNTKLQWYKLTSFSFW